MITEQFEEGNHSLRIQGIDLLFLLSFFENELASFKGFEVMGDHTLF
jgi:hypothetical protein